MFVGEERGRKDEEVDGGRRRREGGMEREE